jgi:hypothetical protein
MADPLPLEDLVDALSALPHCDTLAAAVRDRCFLAAERRNATFLTPGQPNDWVGSATLPAPEQADTPFGNVAHILERGTEDPAERALIAALLAVGVTRASAQLEDRLAQVVANLVWLSAHASCNAFDALDFLLSDRSARDVYESVAAIASGALKPTGFGRLEAMVAAVALAQSTRECAVQSAQQLAAQTADPVVSSMLHNIARRGAWLRGELAPPPHGPLVTVVLTVTLWLLLAHVGRLIGRWVLAYRRPVEVRLSREGLRLKWTTELLGKKLQEKSCVVPLSNLLRISREVRYARAGMYAGLGALVVGTFLGTGLMLDGVRAPGVSGSLLWIGLVCLLGGIGLDFALTTLSDTLRGTCRLVVVQRRGRPLCVGSLSRAATDAMLKQLGQATASVGTNC